MFNRTNAPLNYEEISDLTSAVSYTLTNAKGSDIFLLQPEYGAIRWRDDGTSPTSTTGFYLAENTILEYTAPSGQLNFIAADQGTAGWAISSNFDVQNTHAIGYTSNGISATVAASTACDTGTSKTIAADQWAAMLIVGDQAGALTGTWTADAASEAAAITLVKAVSFNANQRPLGYITVQTASSNTWTAGTDALQGGTGGNPSADTNYYDYRGVKLRVGFYGLQN